MPTLSSVVPIETERLILRGWNEHDYAPFSRLNACPKVSEYLTGSMTHEASHALADKIQAHFEHHGFGLYAVERKDNGVFIGFTGLFVPGFEAHFTPAVEIGWRLASDQWGKGFATEAAMAVRDVARDRFGLSELVSFTTRSNERSRRVMEKIGMSYNPEDDFDYPSFPEGHPLRPHVLYRITLQGS